MKHILDDINLFALNIENRFTLQLVQSIGFNHIYHYIWTNVILFKQLDFDKLFFGIQSGNLIMILRSLALQN